MFKHTPRRVSIHGPSSSALLAALTFVLSTTMIQTASASCEPTFERVSDSIVTNPQNSVIWSMLGFKGKLYVGTANRITGTEIHRYDARAGSWETVVSNGFGNAFNQGLRHMAEYKGMLYASTVNSVTGAEIWRSEDGSPSSWEKVVSGGFGTVTVDTVRALKPFKGYLYAGASDSGDNDRPGQLWRSLDGTNWEPVVINGLGDDYNDSFHRMEVLDGFLYVAIRHTVDGPPQIWRSEDGVSFRQLVGPESDTPAGFGITGLELFYDIRAFRGYLYVGTANLFGFSMHRSADGVVWETVGTDGMGWPGNGQQDLSNQGNIFTWRFEVFEDALWVGVFNYQGSRLWKTYNGLDWIEMMGPTSPYLGEGFGNPLNWGIRTLEELDDSLYIGTAQCILESCVDFIGGAEVWRWSGQACEDSDPGVRSNDTVLFDNSENESGITEPGTRAFTFRGASFRGGEVQQISQNELRASGSSAYVLSSDSARIVFDPPVDSVSFYFVDDSSAPNAVTFVSALGTGGERLAARTSQDAIRFGNPGSFVTLDPEQPIASLVFGNPAADREATYVIDNFSFVH